MEGNSCEWEFYNSRVDGLYRLLDQMVNCNGRHVRIEVAREMAHMRIQDSSFNTDRTLLLISEGMRLALEHSDPGNGLQELMKYMGQAMMSDRAYIVELSKQKKWNNTYEWCANGIEPQIEILQRIAYEETAVWNRQFQREQFVVIRDIEDIKYSDPIVYNYLYPQNITSIIVGPIYSKGELIAFYGVDNPSVERMEEAVSMIRAISHAIATMIEKRDKLVKLETLSYRDSLSNLGNRHAIEEFIRKVDREKSIGVIFCDVCGLKSVNDTLSHAAGDQLLLQACEMLRTASRLPSFPLGRR